MVSFEPGWDGRLGAMMRYASSASTCRRSIIARRARCSSWRMHQNDAIPLMRAISMTLLIVIVGGRLGATTCCAFRDVTSLPWQSLLYVS